MAAIGKDNRVDASLNQILTPSGSDIGRKKRDKRVRAVGT